MTRYVESGGALLVASDRYEATVFRRWGVLFGNGLRLAASRNDRFRGLADCPIVSGLATGHPVAQGLGQVITNRPGYLTTETNRSSRLRSRQTIANLPRLIGHSSAMGPPFAVAVEATENGRALLLADQSVFTNQMLVCGDNAAFAIQSLNWLRNENRRYVLLVVDGRVA